jgi:hypothetical protein
MPEKRRPKYIRHGSVMIVVPSGQRLWIHPTHSTPATVTARIARTGRRMSPVTREIDPETKELQPRAQIYIERHGEFCGWKYIDWVDTMAAVYRKARGIKGPILDHEDFTRFLREDSSCSSTSR